MRLLPLLILAACGPQESADTGPDPAPPLVPELLGARQVVPGVGLSAEVVPQPANNNLDIAWHNDRLFLAFRTAPTHFASAETELYVVSSTDEQNWRFEGRFFEGTDIREPQLVSWNGTLHLYFALLGTDPAAFEPQGSRHTVYSGPGDWSPPEVMFDADFIPWRIKEVGGRLSVTGYTGGGGVYDPDGDPVRVRWLGSDDGLSWSPYIDGVEVLHEGGASESDLVVRDDGSVVAVIRNEGGDTGGFGSKICRGAPDSPGDWTCANDPKKYDSPLVFEEAGRVWLIGRRHLTDDGHYDLGRTDLSPTDQYWLYQLSYWGEPKRCSLWEIDPDALTATWTLDLPSKGDTCFTERVRLGEKLLVYNYSSDPDGPELSWVEGQGDPTGIWRQELDFTP